MPAFSFGYGRLLRVLSPLVRRLCGMALAGRLAAGADQAAGKPYTIENGKVDKGTYNGWRRYTESCMRCHGPDGAGSSYAPDLVESVKR